MFLSPSSRTWTPKGTTPPIGSQSRANLCMNALEYNVILLLVSPIFDQLALRLNDLGGFVSGLSVCRTA